MKLISSSYYPFQMLAAEDIYTFVAVDESWMALMHL